VRQVTSPAESTSRIRHIPLSERSATAANTARVPTETLIGKNARSKANVPSLLRQTSTWEENKVVDSGRFQVSMSSAKKAEQSADTEPESRVAVPEMTVARSERQRSGLADALDDIRQLPKERPPCRNPKARDTAEVGINLVAISGDSYDHPRRTAKQAANDDIHQVGPTSNEPDEPPDKPALPGLRIELRMKQTKKRGLLMVSEKAQKKKNRKSIIGAEETSGTPGVSSQTAASDLAPSHPSGDGHPGPVSNLKTQRKARQRHTAGNDLATEDHARRSQALVLPDSGKPSVDSLSSRENAQMAVKSKAATLGRQQKDSDEELIVQSDAALINNSSEPYSMAPSNRGGAHEDQHCSSSDDPFEEMKPRHQSQDRVIRQTKPSVLPPPANAIRMDTQSRLGAKQRRETVRSNREQASKELYADTPVERTVRQGKKDGDLGGKMRDNIAPPRLAQLSRKSIRSKEVIGWFYEDNEPLIQMRNPAQENEMSELQRRPQATATSIIPNTIMPRLRRESVTQPPKGPGDWRPERKFEAEPSKLNGPRMLLGEQDGSASHTALTDKSPGATASASNSEDGAEAYPPTIYSKPQKTLPKLTKSATAPVAQHRDILGSTAKDPAVQVIDIPDTSYVEEKQVANRPTNLELHVAVASATPVDPVIHWQKPARGASSPVSRNEVDLATSENHTQPVRIESGRRSDREPIRQGGSVSKRAGSVSEISLERGEERPDAPIDLTEGMVRSNEQMPRLVNPATRGRKAAQPTDAAGKVPKCILPPSDGAAGIMRDGIRPIVRILDTAAKESLALPGFVKANGGAWSREAYDLFDYARPS
jgi:hypothetical protein